MGHYGGVQRLGDGALIQSSFADDDQLALARFIRAPIPVEIALKARADALDDFPSVTVGSVQKSFYA